MKRSTLVSLGVGALAIGGIAFAALQIANAQALTPPDAVALELPAPAVGPPSAEPAPVGAAPALAPPRTPRTENVPVPAPPFGLLEDAYRLLEAPRAETPIGVAPAAAPAPARVTIAVPGGLPPSTGGGPNKLQPNAGGLQAYPVPPPGTPGNFPNAYYGRGMAYPMMPGANPPAATTAGFAADPELAKIENQVVNLAQQAKNAPGDEGVRAQLKAALEQAFDYRLELQAEEATTLRERLAKVEAAIEKRKSLRERIIELRLQQLATDPELEWDASAGRFAPPTVGTPYAPPAYGPAATGPTAPPTPAVSPFRLLTPQNRLPSADAAPATSSSAAPTTTPYVVIPDQLQTSGSADRVPARVAAGDWLSAFSAIRSQAEASRDSLETLHEWMAADHLPDEGPKFDRRLRDAERQLANVRADIEKQRRLWELELEKASLSLAAVQNEIKGMEIANAGAKNSYSDLELRRKQIASDQAAIQLQQVKEIVGAYNDLLTTVSQSDPPGTEAIEPAEQQVQLQGR